MKNIKLCKAFASIGVIALFLVSALSLIAAVPNTINYQGYLTDMSDVPIDATENITFSIYDAATAGTLLWSETESVTIVEGKFTNQLGDSVAFPVDLFNGQDLYVGITVGTDSEMSPRKPVTSAPYAFKAATADTATQADNATTLDGNTAASLDQSAHVSDTANPHTVTAAQVGAATSADITAHAGNASAHHSKYTNGEAVIAMGEEGAANTLNHSKYTDIEAVAASVADSQIAKTSDLSTHAADLDAHHSLSVKLNRYDFPVVDSTAQYTRYRAGVQLPDGVTLQGISAWLLDINPATTGVSNTVFVDMKRADKSSGLVEILFRIVSTTTAANTFVNNSTTSPTVSGIEIVDNLNYFYYIDLYVCALDCDFNEVTISF